MSEAKKRCARISKSQKETLVDFMAEDKPFARGQFTDANSRQSNTETWESLCFRLNSQGPNIKTVEQWKKCWTDIKSAAKKQANEIKAVINKTGGGSIADGPRPLSEFEEKVLSIITMDAVDGDASTPEMGLATPFLESLEIMIGAAAVEEEDEFEEPSSKIRKKNKTYDSALQEARAMHRHTSVMEKLDNIISLNKEILTILKRE